ncbi:MAG: hypothetical protein ACLQGP_27300 [Isosphaeraceae bacterium]
MSSVVLDSRSLELLRQGEGRVEIRDEAGQLAGYFIPPVDRSLYESVEVPVSEDELRRRAQKGGGRTLAEILADLEQRG